MPKILCPFHSENTASCEIYSTHYYCFGCGKHGKLEELKEHIDITKIEIKKRVINRSVNQEIQHILSLPTKQIRGLELHYDSQYYYVVWPDLSYYKKRKIDAKTDKYRSPYAVKKTLFEIPGAHKDLLIIEGELNALSASLCKPDFKIVSPGACTDFLRYLDIYLEYDFIYVAFDLDKAGIYNFIKLRDALQQHGKLVFAHPMKKDFNAILTTDGLDETRREVEKIRGLPQNVRRVEKGHNL